MTRTNNRALANWPNNAVSVLDFGAVGDGVTDDTAAIQAAVDAVQNNVISRYEGGQSVYFPPGSYLISSTIVIEEPTSIPSGRAFSNITLQGAGSNSSTIKAVNSDFDYISFIGRSSRAFFGANVIGLGFAASGNATSGAMLKMYRVIGSKIADIKFDGAYQGLVLDGCADTAITCLYAKDDSRTGGSGLTVIELNATEFVCSDIIISDYQIKSTSPTYSFIIRGADGVYASNGHQFGGLRFEPTGIGASQSTASTFWTNVYFDTSSASNVYFAGNTDTPSKYTNHRFTSCDFRDGDRGLFIDTTTAVSNLIVNGCRFATHAKEAMSLTSQTAANIIVADNLFIDSNTLDSALYADLAVDCDDVVISNCIFEGGGSNGKSLKILGNASNYNVSTCSWVNSTMDTKISDTGTGGSIRDCLGVKLDNTGFANIPGATTAFTVDHGLDFTPSQANISLTQLTRGTNSGGVVISYWVDTVTATSFNINLSDAATAGINFAWRAFYK